ncbi:hypothetical protein D9611_003469 [Ephemerocybe angulata]|uniref:Uncharacterized protein n=1 Tax=Ephemerocybe angulata TaxID=980116 RepID=A0A8H5B791_9AGAR|nr:hypothetical protein D9611_003469 [Tulosesus angulatus]
MHPNTPVTKQPESTLSPGSMSKPAVVSKQPQRVEQMSVEQQPASRLRGGCIPCGDGGYCCIIPCCC